MGGDGAADGAAGADAGVTGAHAVRPYRGDGRAPVGAHSVRPQSCELLPHPSDRFVKHQPQNFHHGRGGASSTPSTHITTGGEATRVSGCAPALSASFTACTSALSSATAPTVFAP